MRFPAIFRHAFWRFCLVGAIGFVAYAVFTGVFLELGKHPLIAGAIGAFLAMNVTWICNRSFTFRQASPPSFREWFTYQIVNGSGASLNYGIYSVLILLGVHWFIAIGIGSAAVLVYNFIGNLRITFKERS